MSVRQLIVALALVVMLPLMLGAADNLVLNPNLDYADRNKRQGPLITGDNMDDSIVRGMPNYIIFYGEKCYNSKRMARITVHMYEKYRGKVHFVVVDLDRERSAAQRELANKYFPGFIPHTTILDKGGNVVLDYTGDTEEGIIDGWLDYTLRGDSAPK